MDASQPRRRVAVGRLRALGLPLAVVAIVAASRPEVTQRLPQFFFPVVAALGGAWVLVWFVRSLARALTLFRQTRRVRLLPMVMSTLALVVLVVLPLSHLIGLALPSRDGAPRVLVGFGDWLGGEGYPRPSPHRGIDFKGTVGADVLAAADGRVVVARDNQDLCGLIIVLVHDSHGYRTIYCHSSLIAVSIGDSVARGQRIGAVGTTGQRAWPGYEHVHLELQRGRDVAAVEDPMPRMVGCFDAAVRYPTDRLVLTYPLRC